MMGSEARTDWMNIYEEHMQEIWQQEGRDLRKLAMLHYAYEKELDRLKGVIKDQYSEIKSNIKKKDLNKRKKFTGLAQSEKLDLSFMNLDKNDKENKTIESVTHPDHDLSKIKSEEFFIESPNTHEINLRSPSPEAAKFEQVISPILRKSSFTKPYRKNVSSPAILAPFSTERNMKMGEATFKRQNVTSISTVNPFFFEKQPNMDASTSKRQNVSRPFSLSPYFTGKSAIKENLTSKSNTATTTSILSPLSTVKTPKVEEPTFKRKKASSPTNPRKVPRLDTTRTNLSNMMHVPLLTPKVEILNPKSDAETPKILDDSNVMESSVIEETPPTKSQRKTKQSRLKLKLNKNNQSSTLTQMFLQPRKVKKEFDSNLPSMCLTEMLNYINSSSGSDAEADLESDETVDDLEVPKPSQTSEESSKLCDKSSDVQNQPELNQKNDIKSLLCDECRTSLAKSYLPPDRLQEKLDLCLKHKNNAQLRQETYDGFWDLTFGPTQKSPEKSMVLNYRKT